MDGKTCGMWTCKKCGVVNIIFGVLILVVALGVWDGAPAWWNAWTFLGIYLALWGMMAAMGKQH